jgi:tetratricopeptide (TPR) repeat protein
LLWRTGRKDDAHDEFRTAIRLAEQSDDHTRLSAMYADGPDESLRSPDQALRHAQLISELDISRCRWLGVAQYRLGNWPAAVESLRTAASQPIGDAFDDFFLAMCYGCLNEHPEATRCFEAGQSRIDKPGVTEIDRIQAARAEAEELLHP